MTMSNKPVYKRKVLSEIEKEELVYILIEYIDNTQKIGKTLKKLEREIRKIHARWSSVNIPDRNPMFYIGSILREYELPISIIQSNSRDDKVVEARRVISLTLKREGFNYSQIARLIKKHPSAIRKMVFTHINLEKKEKEENDKNI